MMEMVWKADVSLYTSTCDVWELLNCALRWLVSSQEIKTKSLSVIAEDSSPLFNLPSTPSSRKMYNRREKEPPHPPRPKN